MESQQSQAWFTIAKQVDALLRLPGARERFQERVKGFVADLLSRCDEKDQRAKARVEAVKRDGFPEGSPRVPPDPQKYFYCAVRLAADVPADRELPFAESYPVWGAYLPDELSDKLDPDVNPPLTALENRVVSLAERYTVLAAVWDACWGSEEKIDPWHLSEQPLPLPDGRLSRDDEAAVVYRELVLKVLRNEVSGKYAAFVASWIADVEADLAKSGGPAVPVTPAVVEKRRSGRLPKDESEGRRMDMLATLRTHSSLKDDPAALARLVKVSESTVRRWLQEEEQKYLESKAAQPDDGDET